MKTNCSNCNKEIDRKASDVKRFKNSFCSKECTKEFKTTSVKVDCAECGIEITRTLSQVKKSDSGNLFCNKSCFATYSNKGKCRNWKGGKFSYRERAHREHGSVCNRCGYDKHVEILQVHHINHDREHNELSNLEVLCPNCHTIEHLVKHKTNYDKPG